VKDTPKVEVATDMIERGLEMIVESISESES
jgi:hypothetical protein